MKEEVSSLELLGQLMALSTTFQMLVCSAEERRMDETEISRQNLRSRSHS